MTGNGRSGGGRSDSDASDSDASDSDPPDFESRVADALGSPVVSVADLDGGEVGRVRRVELTDGRTAAVKTGDTPLDTEAFMLAFLGDRGLPVPDVYHADADMLALEYVESDGRVTPAVERDVARHLAALHGERPEKVDGQYGFPRDTPTGPYRQPNQWTDSWVAFFRDRRLDRFAGMAREAGLLPSGLDDRIDALASDLGAWLPDSPDPALLHGDAWANNVLAVDGRVRAFLDPACYFGHAEVELAYVAFAGSFGDPFFEAYDDRRAIASGFVEGRRAVYQLVPLLEHLLFFADDRYAEGIDRRLTDLGY